jgi:hypothetical protein
MLYHRLQNHLNLCQSKNRLIRLRIVQSHLVKILFKYYYFILFKGDESRQLIGRIHPFTFSMFDMIIDTEK